MVLQAPNKHLLSTIGGVTSCWRLECNQCDRRFNTYINLQNHVDAVHNGLRPFHCPKCSKSFAQRATLRTHLRIHTGKCHPGVKYLGNHTGMRGLGVNNWAKIRWQVVAVWVINRKSIVRIGQQRMTRLIYKTKNPWLVLNVTNKRELLFYLHLDRNSIDISVAIISSALYESNEKNLL